MNLSLVGKLKSSWTTYRLIVVSIALFLVAIYLHTLTKKPVLFISKQESAINLRTDFIKFFSLGNKRLLSDLIWVQTLMESDQEHYKEKDLNNWMFLRFDTISKLDPNFYQNYLYGGQFLSIIKDDLPGASIIFERGLQRFPNDYDLNYYTGLMYYFEMGDAEKGIKYLEKIIDNPRTPTFFPSIINKLKIETGEDPATVYQLILHNYDETTDPTLKSKLDKDLYSLKAEIDLKCLNNKKEGCDFVDRDGNPYQLKQDGYYAPRPFALYRIRKRGDESPLSKKSIQTIR